MTTHDPSQLPPFELGNPGPLRDRLVAAVLDGTKHATTSLHGEYQHEPLPRAGERFRLIDSAEQTVAVVEVTKVDITTLGAATLELALAEGEGFTSVADWRTAHEVFWNGDDYVADLGITIADDTEIVVEYFHVVGSVAGAAPER